MKSLNELIEEVESSRESFIKEVEGLNQQQTNFKPDPESWSITEITEHMVWAERAGVSRIWKAIADAKTGKRNWEAENRNKGLSIHELIANTWATKENVPDIARPRWGGPLAYWVASLRACSVTLRELAEALSGMDLESMIYPHPISGPMTVTQRLEFLSFHLDRHKGQVERVKKLFNDL